MHPAHHILIAIAWLIACVWLLKLAEAARGLGTVPNLLGAEHDLTPAGEPSVAVIVPARNEAANVGACLESLVAQDYANLRVIAVDDRSNDGSGALMRAIADAHPGRVEVVTIRELPEHWLGKTHAMAVAARRAMDGGGTDYLLFTDADILFGPSAIRRALAYAERNQADHFVLLPTTIVKTPGEGMLLSFLQVMSLWAIRPWRVPDPKAKRDAVGVGAFNLIRVQAYKRLGGFEAARMEILEDLNLGSRVKRAGMRQRVATAPGMIRVHWAAGALGIVTGMTKNLFAVFRFRPVLLIAAAGGMALFCIGPAVFLGVGGFRIAGFIAWSAAVGLYGLSSRTSRISPLYGLLFPVAAAVVVYSMLRSMAVTVFRGGVIWRGTFYPLSDLREQSGREL